MHSFEETHNATYILRFIDEISKQIFGGLESKFDADFQSSYKRSKASYCRKAKKTRKHIHIKFWYEKIQRITLCNKSKTNLVQSNTMYNRMKSKEKKSRKRIYYILLTKWTKVVNKENLRLFSTRLVRPLGRNVLRKRNETPT